MKAPLRAKITLALCSCLFVLTIAEVGVRLRGTHDADGNFFFHQTRVKPYHAPIRAAEKLLNEYKNSDQTALIYDAQLGWIPRPNFHGTNDGGFFSNTAALTEKPAPNRVRIALFGGSFTQNSFNNGWWRTMEKSLRDAGIDAEILNFGVGAYGMDQAYLRWKLQGAKYHPDIVIFGFVASNVRENVNVIRLLQDSTSGIPFLKPRFAKTHDDITLIGTPTPPLEIIPNLLSHLTEWPLLRQEYFYRVGNYRMRWWRHSRLLAYIEAKGQSIRTQKTAAEYYQMNEEPAQVTLRIIGHFKQDVENAGSAFFVVHLPAERHIEALQLVHAFPFAELFTAVQQITPVIKPEETLTEAASKDGLNQYFREGHHTELAHAIIGKTLADYLIQNAAPLLKRSPATIPAPAEKTDSAVP